MVWWQQGAAARYRKERPMWTDAEGAAAVSNIRPGAVLAAVRSATVGMPVISTACAPFTDGHWAFSHNGRVMGWPHSVAPLAQTMPVVDLLTMDAPTDSALLWARLRPDLAREPVGAVAEQTQPDWRQVREDTRGRLYRPTRPAKPRTLTLRTSHFPDPTSSHHTTNPTLDP